MAGLNADRVRANVQSVLDEIATAAREAGRDPADVELLAATKYVEVADMAALAEAGIRLVGENRAQDLEAKVQAHGELFEWDFIGHLQSRKVRQILPHVRLIHSVASDSVLSELGRHAPPGTEVLVEVNVAGEEGKGGIAPDELGAFLGRSPVRVAGLMTMP
ncbi:MAG: dependent protein, partial [Solirubrobacteraceae bacterium]|nr:dependent protein [Solirubrobacteraceae bacterium]